MAILNELLESLSKSDLDSQVKQICDEIMKEERPNFLNKHDEPIGSNIFLAVQFKDKGSISFLCLERESKETYIISLWSKSSGTTGSLKRKKVWTVEKYNQPEKILKFYAENLKYVRGE